MNLEENHMTSSLGRKCILVLSAATFVAACTPKDNAATDTTSSAGAVATDTANRSVNAGGWSDGQILAFAAAANNGEIAEGRLAETKATNAAVKAYGRQMVTDHRAMLQEGKDFATKNNITPDSTKDDITDLMKESQDEIKELTDKAKGADWDKEFIDHEIDAHKKVLEKLQNAAQSTSNQELKDMLTKATGKVQEHLTKAEDIKANTLKS
jgi:putative membrane protein